MNRSAKDHRPVIAERVVRQRNSLDDGGAAPLLRSEEEEAATRASRYQRVAALFSEWLGQDDDAPALGTIEPLILPSPTL